LKRANIRITLSQNRFRVSVGVFNDMNDIDRLLAVLPKAPPARA
jgi:selenocysteine lyase/cysteine desulfurase